MGMKTSPRRSFRGFTIWLALLCLFVFFCAPASFAREPDAPASSRVIRVGYPIQKGLTEIDETGNFVGYTPDYLRQVSQFTDWEYEFVQVEGNENEQIGILLDMLSAGEIDLLGAMTLSDSLTEQYDFVSNSYGSASRVLCTLADDGELNSANYFTLPNLRIAVLDGAQRSNTTLRQFCEMSGLTAEQIPFPSDVEQMDALRQGKVDLIFSNDITLPADDLKVVTSFMPQPFYFAVTKGRKDLVNELNGAISLISESNPYFIAELHEKHFPWRTSTFSLSKSDRDYIATAKTLRVLMLGGKAPVQYRDRETREIRGLSRDILDRVTELTGLGFEFVMADTYQEYQDLLGQGGFDLTTGLLNDYQLTDNHGFSLTMPYLQAPLTVLVNSRVDPSKLEGKRLALIEGVEYDGGYRGAMEHYDTIEKCIEAVHEGRADYCYGNSYSIQYYQSHPEYKNMINFSRPSDWTQEFCFGVVEPANVHLISILNEAIRVLPQTEFVQDSLYANAYEPDKVTLISYMRTNPLQAGMVFAIIVMFFTIALLLWIRYSDRRNSRMRYLENERYKQLSELSNEYLFEYDVTRDLLTLPEKCAAFLGCGQKTAGVSQCLAEDTLLGYITEMTEGKRDLYCALPNGESRWLRLISKQIQDSDGKTIYSVGKILDIQNEKQRQTELVEKASRDSLTGLYNAAVTRQHVTGMLRQPEWENGALMIIDVDYFKNINDTYGHLEGDRVLQTLSQTLLEWIAEGEIAGRIGGDEFVVFLRNTGDREQISGRCQRLRERIAASSQQAPVSISIGIAFAQAGQSYDMLYQNADKALYEVKKAGRDGFHIFDSGADQIKEEPHEI